MLTQKGGHSRLSGEGTAVAKQCLPDSVCTARSSLAPRVWLQGSGLPISPRPSP